MKYYLHLFLTPMFLLSCTSKEETKRQEDLKNRELKNIEFAKERQNIKEILISKYTIRYDWDTLEYDYSIDYKNVIESKYQIIEDIDIIDIYEIDSTLYVSIRSGISPSFYFDLLATKGQLNMIKPGGAHIILVVSISEIRKIKLVFNSEVEGIESARIDMDESDDFVGKGKIIEIVEMANE